MQKFMTAQNGLLLYTFLSAAANLVKLFASKGGKLEKICDKILALGVDVHKFLGA